MIFQICEILATFVEILLGILVIVKTIGDGKVKWKQSVVVSAAITIIIWIFNQCQLFSVVTTMVAIAGYVISTYWIYRVKIEDALLIAFDYVLVVYIVDFLIISVLGAVFRENQMAQILTYSFSAKRILFLVLSKGILALIYVVFSRYFFIQIHSMSRKMWAVISIGVILVYSLVQYTFFNTDIELAFLWVLLFAFVILGAYSFLQYVFWLKEKSRMEMAEEASRQMRENYETLIQHFQDKQIFFHDLKNHYLVTGNYLKRNEYEKAKAYMQELDKIYPDSPICRWTGIDSLDALIQCKKTQAESYGISVEIFADHIQWELEEYEAITLIGNAFDNAVDACREMEMDRRWIRITLRNVNGMAFLKVSNPCSKEPQMVSGKIQTTKKEKPLHGFGMTSMKLIADKYEGVMNAGYKDGIFTLVISFYNELF